MNSIQKALVLNPSGRSAEIALLIRAHYADGKLLIVVEGSSDKDIYSRFYPKEKYHVHFSAKYSGCLGLAGMLRGLNKKYSNKLIAIKDADFDHLNGVNYPDIPNMFLTDTHDIETMMLTDGFIRQMERDYSVEDGWGKVNTAINDIRHLSYIKWMNDKTGAKLNFKDTCKVGSCYDGMSCTDISQWLSKIYARSANTGKINFSEKDVNEFERNNPIAKDEIRKLVCGHDMVDAIVHKIHACCRKNVKAQNIANSLKDSFTEDYYNKTALYKSINTWLSHK